MNPKKTLLDLKVPPVPGMAVSSTSRTIFGMPAVKMPVEKPKSGSLILDPVLASILNTMQEGVVVINDDDYIVFCNDTAAAILHLDREATSHLRIMGPFEGCWPQLPFVRDYFQKAPTESLQVRLRCIEDNPLSVNIRVTRTELGRVISLKVLTK